MSGPVLICGCPGSGTSFVTKMLRYAGMFAGADAGPVEARKYHESACFVDLNKKFLTQTIDFPYAPKGAWQFSEHIARTEETLDELVGLVDKNCLLDTYWGESDPTDFWGWKDPRNSATAVIWREVFPDLRVLVTGRKWTKAMRRQSGGSLAGEWFRQESTAKVRALYLHPPGVEGLDRYQVDFDKLVTSSDEFNRLLNWIGLPDRPADEFKSFLDQLRIERS